MSEIKQFLSYLITSDSLPRDEIDGLKFLPKALAATGFALMSAGAFVFDDDDEAPHSSRELKKDCMHVKVRGDCKAVKKAGAIWLGPLIS